jgi:hypothetical protein
VQVIELLVTIPCVSHTNIDRYNQQLVYSFILFFVYTFFGKSCIPNFIIKKEG